MTPVARRTSSSEGTVSLDAFTPPISMRKEKVKTKPHTPPPPSSNPFKKEKRSKAAKDSSTPKKGSTKAGATGGVTSGKLETPNVLRGSADVEPDVPHGRDRGHRAQQIARVERAREHVVVLRDQHVRRVHRVHRRRQVVRREEQLVAHGERSARKIGIGANELSHIALEPVVRAQAIRRQPRVGAVELDQFCAARQVGHQPPARHYEAEHRRVRIRRHRARRDDEGEEVPPRREFGHCSRWQRRRCEASGGGSAHHACAPRAML